jgi:hypothetical protein
VGMTVLLYLSNDKQAKMLSTFIISYLYYVNELSPLVEGQGPRSGIQRGLAENFMTLDL